MSSAQHGHRATVPTPSPFSCARSVALTIAVAAISLIALFWARAIERPLLRAPAGDVLADPDSYVQWRLVRRALAGEGVRIRWLNEDNAPIGRFNEWTSAQTIIAAAAVRAVRLVTASSLETAADQVKVWLGPTIALATMIILALAARSIGGWGLAGCWTLAWPLPSMVLAMTRCGNVSHQGLHLLLMAAMLAGALNRSSRWPRGFGIGLGIVCAIALWAAASELLPMWGLIAGLAVYDAWARRDDEAVMRFWKMWWIAVWEERRSGLVVPSV